MVIGICFELRASNFDLILSDYGIEQVIDVLMRKKVGLEDTLLLPTGEKAPDNAALVRAARALISAAYGSKKRPV